jgi:hypothetical protein
MGIKDTVMVKNRDEFSKSDKIRYMFNIHEKDQALACYKFFMNYNKNFEKENIKDDIITLTQ